MLVRCFYSGLVGGLPFVARVALLAYIGGLTFAVCALGGFLLWLLPAYVFLTNASLCNALSGTVLIGTHSAIYMYVYIYIYGILGKYTTNLLENSLHRGTLFVYH